MESQTGSYRIVLVELTRLVADMVERAVQNLDDAAIVGRAASLDELGKLASATNANVVIGGLRARGLPSAYRELLLDRPRAKVLGVLQDCGNAYLYVLQPHETALGELSPEGMVQAIRDAAPRPAPA